MFSRSLIVAAFFIITLANPTFADVTYALWTFNTATVSTTPAADAGLNAAGAAGALVGSTSGSTAGGSTGDISGTTPNNAWSISAFSTVVANSGKAGVQFRASTVGATDIKISFDLRTSNTASKYYQLQATTDAINYSNVSGGTASVTTTGTGNTITWDDTGLLKFVTTSNNFALGITYSFASGSAVENNPNFGFRVVAVVNPVTNLYEGANGTFAGTGTSRFDYVQVFSAVPEPSSIALAAIFTAGIITTAVRRRNTATFRLP